MDPGSIGPSSGASAWRQDHRRGRRLGIIQGTGTALRFGCNVRTDDSLGDALTRPLCQLACHVLSDIEGNRQRQISDRPLNAVKVATSVKRLRPTSRFRGSRYGNA